MWIKGVHKMSGTSAKKLFNGRGYRALLCGALLTCAAIPATAQPLPGLNGMTKETSTSYLVPQPGISLQEATAIARKHTGGKVLSANPRQRGSVMEYRVRMLVDGQRVVTLTVDSEGQIRNRR